MEEDELVRIKKKKLEELLRRQSEISAPKPVIIEVFTSPTCPHCPKALEMARICKSGALQCAGSPDDIY